MTPREHIPVLHNNIFQSMLWPVQTGSVWQANTIKHYLVTKHFTVWPSCLVLFDRVWSCLIKFADIKHSIEQLKSFLWLLCLVGDVLFVWTAVPQRRLVTRRTALWVNITIRYSLLDLSCCSDVWRGHRRSVKIGISFFISI